MKPKFNNRKEYRIFIKGVKLFLNNEIDTWDCPFEFATKNLYNHEKICVKNCGHIFKELVRKQGNEIKGCPCVALPKNKKHTIRKRARTHLNAAIQQYKAIYR